MINFKKMKKTIYILCFSEMRNLRKEVKEINLTYKSSSIIQVASNYVLCI